MRSKEVSCTPASDTGLCFDMSMPSSSITAMAKGSVASPARTPAEPTKTRRPARWRRIAAAIGERTALRLQAKRTAPGRSPASPKASALPVERAEQREQASRRREVDGDLALEPLHEKLAALVVKASPAHVDRLDLRGRLGLDRLVVALADEEIVLNQAAEGREREHYMLDRRAVGVAHGEDEAVVGEREMKRIGTAVMAFECEGVLLEEIEDRHVALVLDLGVVAADRSLVEGDLDQPRPILHRCPRLLGHTTLSD